MRLVRPSATWEFPTVQLVNFLVYAVALLAFRYFWRRLTIVYYGGAGDAAVRFPPAGWLVLGYSLFIWASLDLIEIWAVTPDMAVAAVVYLTAGFMLRMHDEPAGARSMIPLGLLLGFGFLVKAALLPLRLAALALATSASEGPDRAHRLGLIRERLASGVSPARWQRRSLARLDQKARPEALGDLVEEYLANVATGAPVSSWT